MKDSYEHIYLYIYIKNIVFMYFNFVIVYMLNTVNAFYDISDISLQVTGVNSPYSLFKKDKTKNTQSNSSKSHVLYALPLC